MQRFFHSQLPHGKDLSPKSDLYLIAENGALLTASNKWELQSHNHKELILPTTSEIVKTS